MGTSANPSEPGLRTAIDGLGLPPGPTTYLVERWLDQLIWFEAKAAKNQRSHRRLRSVSLVGGIVLPVFVNSASTDSSDWLRIAAVMISVVVGVIVSIESFLRPGERWVQFRQTAELLRSEWWMYVSLAGEYAVFGTLAEADTRFVERVESIVSSDVAGFVAIVNSATAPAHGAGPG